MATETRKLTTEKIARGLSKMKVGYGGMKWDVMVWRVSEILWAVGKDGINIKWGMTLDKAVFEVKLLAA